MFVVAQHTVLDPSFWQIVAAARIPEEFRLLQMLPSADGARGVCLWDTPSLDGLHDLIEPAVGHVCRTEYFAIDAPHAVGLPSQAMSAAS